MIDVSASLLAAGNAAYRQPISRITIEKARMVFNTLLDATTTPPYNGNDLVNGCAAPTTSYPINNYYWKAEKLSFRTYDMGGPIVEALGMSYGAICTDFKLRDEDGYLWAEVDILSSDAKVEDGEIVVSGTTTWLYSKDSNDKWWRQQAKGISLTGNLHLDNWMDISSDVINWKINMPETGPATGTIELANPSGKYLSHDLLRPGNLVIYEGGYHTENGDEYTVLGKHIILPMSHSTTVAKDSITIQTADYTSRLSLWNSKDEIELTSQFRLYDDLSAESGNAMNNKGTWEIVDNAWRAKGVAKRNISLISNMFSKKDDGKATAGTLSFEMKINDRYPTYAGFTLWHTGTLESSGEYGFIVGFPSGWNVPAGHWEVYNHFYADALNDTATVGLYSGPTYSMALNTWYKIMCRYDNGHIDVYCSTDGLAWIQIVDYTITGTDINGFPYLAKCIETVPGQLGFMSFLEATGSVSYREVFCTDMCTDLSIEDVIKRTAAKVGITNIALDNDLVTDASFDSNGISIFNDDNFIMDFDATGRWGVTVRGSLQISLSTSLMYINADSVLKLTSPNLAGVTSGHFRLSVQDRYIALWEETAGLIATVFVNEYYTGVLKKSNAVTNTRIAELDTIVSGYYIEQGNNGRKVFDELLSSWRIYWFLRGDGVLKISRFLSRTALVTYTDSLMECSKVLDESKIVTNAMVECAEGTGNYVDLNNAAKYGYRFSKLTISEMQTSQDGYTEARAAVDQSIERASNREFSGAAQVAQERQDLIKIVNTKDGTTSASDFVINSLSFSYQAKPLVFDMQLSNGFLSERLRAAMRREGLDRQLFKAEIISLNQIASTINVRKYGSNQMIYNVIVSFAQPMSLLNVGDIAIIYLFGGRYYLSDTSARPKAGASPSTWNGTNPWTPPIPTPWSPTGGNTGSSNRDLNVRYNSIMGYFEGYTGTLGVGGKWVPIGAIYVLTE
jgi:hypothetical protein